jgi:hypothetical protein
MKTTTQTIADLKKEIRNQQDLLEVLERAEDDGIDTSKWQVFRNMIMIALPDQKTILWVRDFFGETRWVKGGAPGTQVSYDKTVDGITVSLLGMEPSFQQQPVRDVDWPIFVEDKK